MNTDDRFLLHRARNMAVALDESGKQLQAATVTELIERLEKAIPVEPAIGTVTIEREVFKTLIETSLLFNFWVENVGRLSLVAEAADKQLDSIQFRFALNPPGRRAQFPREAVIQALLDIKQVLSVPHYG